MKKIKQAVISLKNAESAEFRYRNLLEVSEKATKRTEDKLRKQIESLIESTASKKLKIALRSKITPPLWLWVKNRTAYLVHVIYWTLLHSKNHKVNDDVKFILAYDVEKAKKIHAELKTDIENICKTFGLKYVFEVHTSKEISKRKYGCIFFQKT